MHNAPKVSEISVREGYEVVEMNTTVVAAFLIGLLIVLFGSCAVILMVIRGFNESRPSLNTLPASPLATAGIQVPDEPRLQMDPVADRKRMHAENVAVVDTYAQLSDQPGMERYRIPVERAMETMAAGKAPYRQEPAPAAVEMADPFAEDSL